MRKVEMHELNRLDADEYNKTPKIELVVVLDNVRSAINVGSIFRTSDAFRVKAIFICGYTPCPPHRDINKSALGATDTVKWEYFQTTEEAVKRLKIEEGYKIVALEQTEPKVWLQDFGIDKSEKYALVLGNEVDGVSDEVLKWCDYSLEIPQEGTKHSLNVSVAAGIAIWHFFNALK